MSTTTRRTGRGAVAVATALGVLLVALWLHGVQVGSSEQADPGPLQLPPLATQAPSGIKVGFWVSVTSNAFKTGQLNVGEATWHIGGRSFPSAPLTLEGHADFLHWVSQEYDAHPGEHVKLSSTLHYGYSSAFSYLCAIIAWNKQGLPTPLRIKSANEVGHGFEPTCTAEADVPANW